MSGAGTCMRMRWIVTMLIDRTLCHRCARKERAARIDGCSRHGERQRDNQPQHGGQAEQHWHVRKRIAAMAPPPMATLADQQLSRHASNVSRALRRTRREYLRRREWHARHGARSGFVARAGSRPERPGGSRGATQRFERRHARLGGIRRRTPFRLRSGKGGGGLDGLGQHRLALRLCVATERRSRGD